MPRGTETNRSRIIRASDKEFVEFGETTDGSIYLGWLESQSPGTGKRLISKFVREVGPGKEVYGWVVEDETLQKLSDLGLTGRVLAEKARIEVTDQKTLSSLKIVRVLQGGGLKVKMLNLNPVLPDDDKSAVWVRVLFFGST